MELSNVVISVATLDISHDVFHLGTFSLYCSAFWWNNVDNAEKKICMLHFIKKFQVQVLMTIETSYEFKY